MITVELVYVTSARKTVHFNLELAAGATVLDALNSSGIYQTYPETKRLSLGIYAKLVTLDTVLKEGDRLEIYRPLVLDPKETRRQKARIKAK
jgi:uncharacterized protein